MKIGLFSTSDIEGGAPRATFRLFQGLRRMKADVELIVQRCRSREPGIVVAHRFLGLETNRVRTILDRLPVCCIDPVKRPGVVPNWVPDSLAQLAARHRFDVVHLNLVSSGFLRVENVPRFRQPIVWTLHDMWTFTGGCHYSQGCERYVAACGACPLLGKSPEVDLSRRIWQRKRSAWRNLNLTVVAPSNWMKECIERSSLLGEYPVVRIPYGIDTDLFQPQAQAEARQELGLPDRAHVVLFGASLADSDRRKGFDLLRAALAKLPAQIEGRPVMAVVFGNTEEIELAGMSIPLVCLGPIRSDARLRTIYSAADVFAAPSREDNLPNTVIESLSCGTPCVAFQIGGMPDLIKPGHTGRLVTPFDTNEFSNALSTGLQESGKEARQAACRRFVLENFTLVRQATEYARLYEKVLSESQLSS